jgi:glycosyltransferase involved in cell wall biosynthesis
MNLLAINLPLIDDGVRFLVRRKKDAYSALNRVETLAPLETYLDSLDPSEKIDYEILSAIFLLSLKSAQVQKFEEIALREIGKLTPSSRINLCSCVRREYNSILARIRPKETAQIEEILSTSFRSDLRARMRFLEQLSDQTAEAFSDKRDSGLRRGVHNGDKLIILVEELSSRPKSTVNKLIADWVYVWLRQKESRKIELVVVEDSIAPLGSIFGTQASNRISLDGLFSTIEGFDFWDRVRLIYRRGESIPEFISRNIFDSDALAVVEFPAPKWALSIPIGSIVPTVGIELANGMNISRGHAIVIPNGVVGQDQKKKYGDKLFPCHYPQIPFPAERVYARSDFGIPRGAFVVVSVGRSWHSRATEADRLGFRALVRRFISTSDFYWVLVGESPPSSWLEDHSLKTGIAEGRLLFIDDEPDLVALYALCDLFVMPPIGGGGRGIGLAASSGLPIFSLPNSDGAKSLPSECIADDMEGLSKLVFRAARDGIFLEAVRKISSEVFGPSLLEAAANGLQDACELARIRFAGSVVDAESCEPSREML